MCDSLEAKPQRPTDATPLYDPLEAIPQRPAEGTPAFPEPKQNWWLVAPLLILAILFTAYESTRAAEPDSATIRAMFNQLDEDTFVAIQSVNHSILKDADAGVLGSPRAGFPDAADTVRSASSELCKLLWALERALHHEISLREWSESNAYNFHLRYLLNWGYVGYHRGWAAAVNEIDSTHPNDDPSTVEPDSYWSVAPVNPVIVTDGALNGLLEQDVWWDLGSHVEEQAQRCAALKRDEYFD